MADCLRELGAALVIHTAGPFQQQGYGVPLAVAEAGAHYIDLADGRRFVCDFAVAVDDAFRRQRRVAITGASTVPALSSAVVNHLTEGWQRIDRIDFCIAPVQTAPRGVATLAAVLDYCGAPVQVWENGAWVERRCWSRPEQVRFLRLRPRIGALCDIPDLELFPQHYRGVHTVMFRAALEIGMTQRALSAVATCRQLGLIRRPDRFARLFNRTAGLLDRFGSALGGMVVRVTGTDANGIDAQRAWHIAADNDHGPEIPCMAAILLARRLARRLAREESMESGARTAMGLLALPEFVSEFNRWKMVTDIVDEAGSRQMHI
ncbi:saccharopine dehydrogenase [Noviherbaspirillum sedimenti]|uniref:Saccharopine dehydrogenase n=1 Tax=Noviherbaspirillum sedimenti TaxID=2320865 RepID=A0A3A3G643_9BURK|nr:saccharopine dehydrogenase [Noviherbaspirillum sedimenti]